MKKWIAILLIVGSLGFGLPNNDLDIAVNATKQALITQVRYETQESMLNRQIKDLNTEVNIIRTERFALQLLLGVVASFAVMK